ncbi:MAG: hypothetical protein IPJ89_00090 [Candidatus Iainarchaeum archaeon]|uniref:Uncharacterized protein n=1 Tax=Candidatus Iainarchaeum sp. TaxID=3101447 RepID=A0A7T9I2D1_9ARCH|nr:MAG: hypothetical protein IPJ89_00090 [Candidatus Diapherotrites archaeon]
MPGKFEPYLLGVKHTEYFAKETQEKIDSLPVRRIGVELTPRLLRHYRASGLGHWFWHLLIRGCEAKGIKLVPLVPAKFEKLNPSVIRAEMARMEQDGKHNRLSALVDDVMTRAMQRKAIRENVDMIITGSVHAALMRKDLRIPKSKFDIIDKREITKKKMLKSVMATRRYQRERKNRPKPAPISRIKRARLRFLHVTGISRLFKRKPGR